MESSDSKPDKIVLVVHGVGDPAPGHTLNVFARSLADHENPLVEREATIWLEEKSEKLDHVKTFPAHNRQAQFDKDKVEFCEAFWGDLSRVRRGWIGIFQGLFQILFGLRYVAYVAADQPGKAAHWLKTLGLMSSRILHGPVLAVTVYLGMLVAAVCGTHVVWKDSHTVAVWTQIVIMACSGLALIAAQVGSMLTRSRVVERFWFWMNATTAFVTGLMLVRLFWLDHHYPIIAHSCEIHPGLMWYCRTLLILLGMLWFIEIQVIVAMMICWLVAINHKRTYNPALHVGFLLPAMAVGIWGQIIPMFWLGAKESIGALANLKEFSSVFDDAIPFLGIQLVMLVLLLFTALITIANYARWRKNDPQESYQSGRKAPRLIVPPSLQTMLGFCTVVGVILVSSLWLMNTFGNYETYTKSGLGTIMTEANGYAIAALVPMGGLMFFVLPHLRPGFDMILDVVNHFYFRPTNVADVLDDDDEFDISETTFENGMLFFSRREVLHGRVKRILSHYRDQYSHSPELVLVAHSQGTMVAIESLNDDDLVWLNNSFRRVTLVTMGSPFHHLYQHYFGHCYPSLDQPYWSSLRRRIDRWVNIFRIDDYVGNEIPFPKSLQQSDRQFQESYADAAERDPTATMSSFDPISIDSSSPHQATSPHGVAFAGAPDTATQAFYKPAEYQNFSVGPRGHQSYWTDREVLDLFRKEILGSGEEDVVRRAA